MAYTIQRGESKFDVAKKLGISVDRLVSLNPEAFSGNMAYKYAGTVLRTKPGENIRIKDPIADLAEQVTKNVKKINPFSDIYGTEDAYLKAQSPLAEQGVAEQTNKFFLPQVDEGVANIRTELANRGLFRSGIRGKAEVDFFDDIAKQELEQRTALMNQRELELRKRYQNEQSIYDKASQTGAKYKPGQAGWNEPVVVNPAFNPMGSFSGDKYSQVSAYEGNDSNSKYGAAYKKWFEDRYKKTRPDVNYNL